MALFDNFPYTDFHELNADWLLKTVKTWTDKYTTFNEALTALETGFDDLKAYVDNWLDSVDVETAVNDKLDEMYADGTLERLIEDHYRSVAREVECNIVKNVWIDYTANPANVDGACYIGSSKMAVYFSSGSTDTGTLRIYSTATWELLEEHSVKLYHGNSLTYNPNNDKLYAAGCYTVADTSVLIPTVVEVDLNDFTTIEITPTLPEWSEGIYAIAFDITRKKFYATVARGTTAGQYNAVCVYSEDLETLEDTIILDSTMPTSSQGIQYANNGYVYIVYYSTYYKNILQFSIDSKKRVNVFNVPNLINGYRETGELENLVYDYDTDEFYTWVRYSGSGVYHHLGAYCVNLGISHAIPVFMITDGTLYNTSMRLSVSVNQGADFVTDSISSFCCIKDALVAQRTVNSYMQIGLTGSTRVIGDIVIHSFNGIISGSSSSHISIYNIRIYNSNIRFTYCDFLGTSTSIPDLNDTGCLAFSKSYIVVTGSTFAGTVIFADSFFIPVGSPVMHGQDSFIQTNSVTTGSTLTRCGVIARYS